MQLTKSLSSVLAALILGSSSVMAKSEQQSIVQSLSDQWADAIFVATGDSQRAKLQTTLQMAKAAVTKYESDANVLGWAGIIEASYAGTQSGLSALRHAKRARKYLKDAIDANPEALDGGARSTLGVLYYKVPVWPIGFGDKSRAEKLLLESAQRYPNSLNAQYFYGEFLIDRHRKDDARKIFEQALLIPDRSDYRIVDSARKASIREYLNRL